MKTQSRDSLVLVDLSSRVRQALEGLSFIPRLSVRHVERVPDPDSSAAEPLVYLIGEVDAFREPNALIGWMDKVHEAGGAPVALLLPREDREWYAATTHPQFCGLLPTRPEIPADAMERVLQGARQNLARRGGRQALQRASLRWNFSTREAADPEQAWLLLESSLSTLVGQSSDLSCLGMAFSEALTNAVEHGNLELESTLKDRADDGLLRFFEERDERLADPAYSRRRIRVRADLEGTSIRVRIQNQGQGFDLDTTKCPVLGGSDVSLSHGLGLTMIQSLVDEVEVSADGRSITLIHHVPRGRMRSEGDLPRLMGRVRRRSAA